MARIRWILQNTSIYENEIPKYTYNIIVGVVGISLVICKKREIYACHYTIHEKLGKNPQCSISYILLIQKICTISCSYLDIYFW